MATGDERPPRPPSADRVARRALVLAALTCRGGIEGDAGNAEAEQFRGEVVAWAREVGLESELEAHELEVLETPLGGLTARQHIDSGWRSEGLAVLAWALRRHDLPPYDRQVDGYVVAESLGFRRPREATVLASPRLRPHAEIVTMADVLLALHWRLRQYSLRPERLDFRRVAARMFFGTQPLAGLRLRDGDLEIAGRPLFETSEDSWRTAMSIARERQQAANWLLGEEPVYSLVTCDT